jgi:flagellar biosynthesis/type III secretory pathway protein FliH
MTLAKGRVLRESAAHGAKAVTLAGIGGPPRGQLVPRAVAEAAHEAAQRLARAEQAARAVLDEAERTARAIRDEARAEGRQEAVAELAAAWIKLRTEEAARDERDLDRAVALARAIAERLVGETLRLDPPAIIVMARQVLASARQARHIVLRAHPEDAATLRATTSSLGLEQVAIEIHADETRTRGSLLAETDLGILDADLTIQLDRLARSLRDSLRP